MNSKPSLRAIIVFISWFIMASTPALADRLDDFKKLDAEYKVAEQKYLEARVQKEETTPADDIRNYENWPGWQYMPRFVALAEVDPADEAAYHSCEWIFDRSGNVGTDDHEIFAADQKAWQIIAAHHAKGDKVPDLCLEAAQYLGPMREKFLRELLKQEGLSKEHAGFATLALAETLASKCDYLEFFQRDRKRTSKGNFATFVEIRKAPEFHQYITAGKATTYQAESARLFHAVLDHYSDVPITKSMRHFRSFPTIGEKAEQSLYALEHLSVGAEAPDIVGTDLDGNPLKLKDYRGRIVVLSFWFTGCGPCMAMIPKERELVATFKDRPFTLLGVCGDSAIEQARITAKEKKIDWPCLYDGPNGPIAQHYNVLGWPTLYLIHKTGRIAMNHMDRNYLNDDIAELLNKDKKTAVCR
jgi:peroxiredoxin